VKIFRLKEHIPNISFQRVVREGNHCAYFFAKLGHSLKLGVTFWHALSSELKSVLRLEKKNSLIADYIYSDIYIYLNFYVTSFLRIKEKKSGYILCGNKKK